MATNYKAPAGQIRVISGFGEIKKMPLPLSVRQFPAGSPMWTNTTAGVEPALIPSSGVGESTYTTVALANAAFAPLFVGFAASARVGQQFRTNSLFNVDGAASTAIINDSSRQFIGVYDEGVAEAPFWDGTNSTVQGIIEVGTRVAIAGFLNDGTTGFYSSDGVKYSTDTKSYLYNNCVVTTATRAVSIGVVVERANIGDSTLKFSFKANQLDGQAILA